MDLPKAMKVEYSVNCAIIGLQRLMDWNVNDLNDTTASPILSGIRPGVLSSVAFTYPQI